MARIRTGFSFRTAFGKLEDVASRLSEIGWARQPISDTCSTFGFVRWSKVVPDPMYGVELGVEHEGAIDRWTFFAQDQLADLHTLIGLATDKRMKGEPTLTYDQAQSAKGVIKITGNRMILSQIDPKTENLFMALSPSTPIGLYREARKRKMQFIASGDNSYPRVDDKEVYRMALWRWANTQSYPQHILSDDELIQSLWYAGKSDIKTALANRQYCFDKCVAKLHKATLFVPEKPKTLHAMCVEGAKIKNIDLGDEVYRARLKRELDLIEVKGYEDYFYLIADLMQWARANMLCGPGRGSSGGSLVCFLLDITTVDPIPYGLLFERFVDVSREDMPDIDLDLDDQKRSDAFDYLEKKYGRAFVARLGTVGMFRPRSALNAAGMALQIPKWKIEKLSDSIVVRSSGDARALQQLEDTLKDTDAGKSLAEEYPSIIMAGKLEGHPVNSSQHAAGVVITAEPIANYVAIDHRTYSTMCDKKDAEDLNLLKIDMLGLTQLSIFSRALELAGIPFKGFFEKLPLDDKAAFKVLNDKHFSGVFQFNGIALQSLSKQVKIDKLEDIIAITALARPGAMASGNAGRWVKRRIGVEPVTYPHETFEPYLKDDLGVVIYQEQVLRIGREIGDLSWEDVTQLRKSMSKSLGAEYFDKWGIPWKAGARKKGIPENILDDMWKDLTAYGSWSFNRSHAVAYGLVSYYCCYLKAHYPLEFAAATLDAEAITARQINTLRELENEGIGYLPVDAEASELRWAIKRGKTRADSMLVGPLTSIHGIGPKIADQILESRASGKQLSPAIMQRLKNPKTFIDSLYPVTDALKKIDLKKLKVNSTPTEIINVQCDNTKGEVIVIGVASRIAPKDGNETVEIAKRGGKVMRGPTKALHLFIRDDTDTIFCKVNRYDFEKLGRPIVETGRAGHSIYAIKGSCPKDFRMLRISNIRYLGELDQLGNIDSNKIIDQMGE